MDECLERSGREPTDVVLRLERIDHAVFEQLAGFVDHGDFAAGANAGVDASTPIGPAGGASNRFSQILAEHSDGLDVRALLQFQAHFRLDGETSSRL